MMCTLPSAVALQSFLVMTPLGPWVQILCRSRPLYRNFALVTQIYSVGTDIIICSSVCEEPVSVAGSYCSSATFFSVKDICSVTLFLLFDILYRCFLVPFLVM
jgi:hypothetical protein